MYINLHMLFTFAAGNPNTDETGAAKTVTYGGATRGRISSSAMTRPKRIAYESDREDGTYRSRNIADIVTDRVADRLKIKAADPVRVQIADDAGRILQSLTTSSEKTDKKRQAKTTADEENGTSSSDRVVKDTAIWLSEDEVDNLVAALAQKWGKNGDKDQQITSEMVLADRTSRSLSIAMFGRMFANAPQHDTEAAVQRSHAFTTHGIEQELDLIATVDDLNRPDEKGAAFIGQRHLGSGVYYWHANINTNDLVQSWDRPADNEVARTRLISMLDALLLALPDGRINSSAIHGAPRMVLAVPATMSASFQAAFESPVLETGEGYLIPSEQRLLREYEQTRAFASRRFLGKSLLAVVDDTGLDIPTKTLERVGLDDMIETLADLILATLDAENPAA